MGGGSIIHLVLPIFEATQNAAEIFKMYSFELNCEITAVGGDEAKCLCELVGGKRDRTIE